MKKSINSSWYKITPEELKTKQYNNRNINELMAKAGYKDRFLQSKKKILPRIVNSAGKKNNTDISSQNKNMRPLKTINNTKIDSPKKKQYSYQNIKINSPTKNIKNKKEEIKRRSKKEMTRVVNDDDICSYCLSFLEEPITLKCCHRICKNCLEEMITFNNFIKETQGTNKTIHDIFNIDNW